LIVGCDVPPDRIEERNGAERDISAASGDPRCERVAVQEYDEIVAS